jgi:hypothetical protein
MGKWEEKNAPGKKLLVYEYGSNSEQDTVTIRMLINNRINGLVPCSFSQVDDDMTIKFDISSKLRFSDFITRPTTFYIAVDLLISMCRSFLELKKYMIGIEALVLDDYEKIFVDTSVPAAEFIINPILCEQHRVDYRSFFLNIISNLMLDESGRQYVGDMISLVNNNFSLEKFIDGLEQLKTRCNSAQNHFSQEGRRKPEVTPPKPAPQRHDRKDEENSRLDSSPIIKEDDREDDRQKSAINQSEKKSDSSGGFLGRVFGKIKSDESKPKPKPKSVPESKPKSASGAMAGFAIPGQDEDVVGNYNKPKSDNGGNKPVERHQQHSQVEKMFEVRVPKQAQSAETEYVAPVSRSLSDDDTTEIMKGNMESGHARLIGAGRREVIEIDKDTFFIGRDPKECVDYVINDGRVSRRHASIIRRGDKYYLSDNKSSNNTFLNGKKLTPYDEYEIKTGDLIIFAAVEFTFEV